MAINGSAFEGQISNSEGYGAILDVIGKSSQLTGMVNYFSGANGRFELVDGGSGSKVVSSSSIVIDRSELPAAGDEAGALRFAGLLAHELGHVVYPGGLLSVMFTHAFYEAQNAAQAAVIALRQEGIATYAEYLVSQELGTMVRGGEQLQQTLNDLAKKYSLYSADFKEAAIVASASAYMSVTPSTAPNLTYGEFYSEAWYANKAGLDPNAISWQTTYSDDIQVADIGGGITRVTTSRPIAVGTPGTVSTKSFSLDVNSSGQVVKQFTTIDSYDGFKYAQVRGDGQYYLNDTIVSAGQSDTGTLYATVIGNGNDLYVFDGNEIRLVGQENYLVTNGSDRIVVEGDHNTLDVNGYVDSIIINDQPVPNYVDGISYIGDNAVGFGNSDVGWGSNWPGKEYDVPQPAPQNRTAPPPISPAAPLQAAVANIVGLKDADVPELILV